jgi:predicted alpha/beta-fold hydrolase
VLIERKLNGWKHLAEFYDEKSSSKRMDRLQTAYKTILPKLDPLLVEDVILNQQQNQEDVENDITTYDMTSDKCSPLDRVGPTKDQRQSN